MQAPLQRPRQDMDHPNDNLILAINAGSSSLKFSLYRYAAGLAAVAEGAIDTSGSGQLTLTLRGGGAPETGGASCVVTFLTEWLDAHFPAIAPRAVSHRVVSTHPDFAAPAIVTAGMLASLRATSDSASDHLPLQTALIETLQRRYPSALHVACFDSGFHATMPAAASMLPIPRRLQALGLKRHGFHGISCDYVVGELARVAGHQAAQGKLVVAHLGSGSSITAIEQGQSRDTTMGLSPAGGIMMARRSGDLDPALAWELARREGMDADAFHHLVNHESGLLGVSGSSADMRTLLGRQAIDAHAAEAVTLFCYHARKAICAMAGAIDGLDTLVFTGGIGEHAAPVREQVCAGLSHLGVVLDPARNAAHAAVISAPAGRVRVRVMPADEQRMLATYAQAHLT